VEASVHRKPILDALARYLERWPGERLAVDHVTQFVRANPDCCERSCREGHITGAAWIVSADGSQFLLTHHKKLGKWLQLGGHADGDADVPAVALREAREESGMEKFEWLDTGGPASLLDVDVHLIPARGDEPPHLHHDLRYLLRAGPDQPLAISHESSDLRWFPSASAEELLANDAGLLRMARKANALLRPR
jgi:8-oxo-dGTP pyrophosphatase MutT (NUDIX family)